MAHLTWGRIEPQDFVAAHDNHRRGASVLFFGIVRDHSEHKRVTHLEYEAYVRMAEPMLEALIATANTRWQLEGVCLVHRLGCVPLGEIAVAIEVSAAHRDEAYRASRYLIDEIKHGVPIWKKEFYTDGSSEWSLCGHPAHPPHDDELSTSRAHAPGDHASPP